MLESKTAFLTRILLIKGIVIIGAMLLCSFSGCDRFGSDRNDDEPVARVQDQYLYAEEVRRNIPSNLDKGDSVTRANKYIKSWVERQLMVNRAEQNLKEEKEEIKKKLDDYRNDLLIYSYQTQLVNQKLDTTISDRAIKQYYENHKERFVLKDYILKVNYIKLDLNAPKLDKAKQNLMSDSEDDFAELEDYCFQFAANFYLDRDKWVYLDDLMKEIPVEIQDRREFLNNKGLVEFYDEDYVYLIRILDARLKEGQSPLSLEREHIKDIILNKRKVDFLSKLKSDIFNEAERKNNFEIY